MPADIGEGAYLAVVAANDDDAFAEIIEASPSAGLDDFAFMADDLRSGAKERVLLGREEFGIVIQPAWEADAVERIIAASVFRSRVAIARLYRGRSPRTRDEAATTSSGGRRAFYQPLPAGNWALMIVPLGSWH